MNVKAIFFDMDDTLYSRLIPFSQAMKLYFGEDIGERINLSEAFKAYSRRGYEVFEPAHTGKITMQEMYIFRFQKAMEDMGITIESEEDCLKFQDYYQERLDNIAMSQALKDMLSFCVGKGLPIGIITDGASAHQRDKIRQLGIDKWIPEKFYLISGDHDSPKPNRLMFDLACERAGCRAEDMIYVGDSYSRDIIGSSVLGWNTIYYDRSGEDFSQESIQPGWVVRSDEELEATVREILR